jgi:UDP-N-acetylmuramyl pentapeptide phosphotransferase/UDP-N-acetylglucosamine-1-phosphate transferase
MMLAIVLGLAVSTYGSPVHLVHFYFALGLIWYAGFIDDLLNLRPEIRLLPS